MIKNICKNCGKEYEYEPKKGTYKFQYCSIECRNEFNKKDKEPQFRICEHCGKEYWWDGSVLFYGEQGNKVDTKKFCCYECGTIHKYDRVKKTTIEHFGAIGYASKELCKKTQDTKMRLYGSKNNYNKIEKTNLEKYGVKNVSQVKEYKEKVQNTWKNKSEEEKASIDELRKKTAEEKYGDPNWRNSEKTRQTCLATFGVENATQSEVVKEKIKETNLKRYGTLIASQSKEVIEKIKHTHSLKTKKEREEILQKTIKTNLEKYNTEFPPQAEEIKTKIKKTNLEKYGTVCPVQSAEIQEKIKEHNLEKYGCEYAIGSKEVQEKIKTTNKQKYGYEYPFQDQSNRSQLEEKRKKTNLERYNTPHIYQVPEFKEKACKTNMEKYGVLWNCLRENAVNANGKTISKVNLAFKKKLDALGIENKLEFCLKGRNYDFKVEDDLLIEINPTYTHNSSITVSIGHSYIKPKEIDYHFKKSQLAMENGYRCIHIWDWDDKDKIINLLKPKTTLYARKLEVKEVSFEDTGTFLSQYHIQNSCSGQDIRLGLYKDDELVEIMTFGKPRYNKKYEHELLRLCTKDEYKVVGGAEKLFKFFVNKYKPSSIVSYCDNSKFTGEVYTRLGMELKSYGKPTKHWYNVKTDRHFTDNLVRQRGYSQLHNDKLHTKGESNDQLMLEAGYLEIYDCGQSTYIWKL